MPPQTPVSRRTFTRGTAWAIPTIAVSAAAPALAASSNATPPVTVDIGAQSCKITGGVKRYRLAFDFTNVQSANVEVRIVSITVQPGSGAEVTFTGALPTPWRLVPVKGGSTVVTVSDSSSTSANGTATITYEYRAARGAQGSTTSTLVVSSLPPC